MRWLSLGWGMEMENTRGVGWEGPNSGGLQGSTRGKGGVSTRRGWIEEWRN